MFDGGVNSLRSLFITLALAVACAATNARAEWSEARSDHFIVVGEGSQAEVKNFAEKLERFDNALRVLQNMPVGQPVPDAEKVTVFRFGQTSDIGDLAGSPGVAGFYIPRAAHPVAFTPARETVDWDSRLPKDRKDELEPETVLFHEYTHHFMLRNFSAAYPGWYVEGFAELNSTIKLNDDGSFIVGRPANHRSVELFKMMPITVRRLLDPSNRVDTIEEVLSRYSLGWLLIHKLTFDKDRAGQLDQYLIALNKGENSLTAAERIFGDLGKLDSELQRYKQTNLPGVVVRPASYAVPKVAVRPLTREEEEVVHERIQLSRGVTRKQARELAGKLDARASTESQDFPLQVLAAEAGLDAQNFEVANAAADRALALKPESPDALVYKARALIEPKTGPNDRFEKARALLVRAHREDPADARPLIETYDSYRRAGNGIPEIGYFALEDAFPLAAQDRGYRLTLTRQLIEMKKYDLAQQVIAPLAYSYDGRDPTKDVPSIVLEAIIAGKYEDALSRLNKALSEVDDS